MKQVRASDIHLTFCSVLASCQRHVKAFWVATSFNTLWTVETRTSFLGYYVVQRSSGLQLRVVISGLVPRVINVRIVESCSDLWVVVLCSNVCIVVSISEVWDVCFGSDILVVASCSDIWIFESRSDL